MGERRSERVSHQRTLAREDSAEKLYFGGGGGQSFTGAPTRRLGQKGSYPNQQEGGPSSDGMPR